MKQVKLKNGEKKLKPKIYNTEKASIYDFQQCESIEGKNGS